MVFLIKGVRAIQNHGLVIHPDTYSEEIHVFY